MAASWSWRSPVEPTYCNSDTEPGSEPFDGDHPARGRALPDGQHRPVLRRRVPRPGLFQAGEFEDYEPLGGPIAFERLGPAAAGHVPAAVLGHDRGHLGP